MWNGIGWLLDTQVQPVGLTVFVWKDLMRPPLMALSVTWGDRSVLWLLAPGQATSTFLLQLGLSLPKEVALVV